jgi:N-acetylglucosaminyldiphosphoundecaprenol N-acetyl-beta-D-mannosaminyltransferase
MDEILPSDSAQPVFGYRFSPARMDALLDFLAANPVPPGGGVCCIVTTNLDHVCNLRISPAFRRAYETAWLRTIDGMPVYAKLRGAGVPARITGADLFPALLARLDPSTDRPFFVVPNAEVGAALIDHMCSSGFPKTALAHVSPPHGFLDDPTESERLAKVAKAHRATHFFMGVGSPRSELWVDAHRSDLGDLYALCVGAALEFQSGHKARAPLWMRKSGFEWLWRLAQEPRRLARRYLVNSWGFLAAIVDDLRRRNFEQR